MIDPELAALLEDSQTEPEAPEEMTPSRPFLSSRWQSPFTVTPPPMYQRPPVQPVPTRREVASRWNAPPSDGQLSSIPPWGVGAARPTPPKPALIYRKVNSQHPEIDVTVTMTKISIDALVQRKKPDPKSILEVHGQ